MWMALAWWTPPAAPAAAGDAANVLLVVNQDSPVSGEIGEYYARRRSLERSQICAVRAGAGESIERSRFRSLIEAPLLQCLARQRAPVHYLVLTAGLPLRVSGTTGINGTLASVDSELMTLYARRAGLTVPLEGGWRNPYFGQDAPFQQKQFPIYLVGRLAAYDVPTVKRMIDDAMRAENRGLFVFDMKEGETSNQGDAWLNSAALQLPGGRSLVESSRVVLTGPKHVIGYASWGSNDPMRKQRLLGAQWLPGSVATEFVSTNGRTLMRPPKSWNLGNDWRTPEALHAGSPQSMAADYLAEGASAVTGHTDEPYLGYTPRPDFLFPAYHNGRTLGEAYARSLAALSWRNILLGDPLMRIGPPPRAPVAAPPKEQRKK